MSRRSPPGAQALHDDNAVWRNLRAAVTAIDEREPIVARIERRDGMMIDMTTMPLPDGATLVTFQDVSDTVNVERALREKNEALETADAIKIDFVHHVSYELRSPLTNIIGFANLLGDPAFGPLTDKQREYLGYITTSTNALLALINNILDLASIDAGAMSLSLSEVDIRASMEEAAEGVQDRLVKDGINARDQRRARHRQFQRRRAAAAADSVQSAVQRGRLLARRRDRHAGGRAAAATRWCSRSSIAGPAFRRRRRTRCSTGSRPIRWARSTAAPGSASRWCARSSSCMAAR